MKNSTPGTIIISNFGDVMNWRVELIIASYNHNDVVAILANNRIHNDSKFSIDCIQPRASRPKEQAHDRDYTIEIVPPSLNH